MSELTCPSCGVPYVNHLGLIGTCKKLQDAAAEIDRLREVVRVLREPALTWKLAHHEMLDGFNFTRAKREQMIAGFNMETEAMVRGE